MGERLGTTEGATASALVDPQVAELEDLMATLASLTPAADGATRIDRIRRLEEAKGTIAAAQARETGVFKQARVAERQAAGLTGRRVTRGIGAEVALARRESPYRQSRLVGLAEALVQEMPHTMAALSAGEISEWRAIIVVTETACLSLEHRRIVDAELADRIGSLSDMQLRAEARAIAYRLDPYVVVNRASQAEQDRRVTSRPVPDTMMNVTATLPVVQGAAVMAVPRPGSPAVMTTGLADRGWPTPSSNASPDKPTPTRPRSRSASRSATAPCSATAPNPAGSPGTDPVPAPWLRDLLRRLDDQTKVWVRRFFTDPAPDC